MNIKNYISLICILCIGMHLVARSEFTGTLSQVNQLLMNRSNQGRGGRFVTERFTYDSGKILELVLMYSSHGAVYALMRLLPDGSLDTTFASVSLHPGILELPVDETMQNPQLEVDQDTGLITIALPMETNERKRSRDIMVDYDGNLLKNG